MGQQIFEKVLLPTVIAIAGAVVGATVQILIPMWRESRRCSQEKDLLGDWQACWTDPKIKGSWISERINMSVERGKIKLVSSQSDGGYQWEGYGRIHDNGRFLYGVWRSVRPGAYSTGVFSLLVLSQGDAIAGYWIGPKKDGHQFGAIWALGRDAGALENAKEWLRRG